MKYLIKKLLNNDTMVNEVLRKVEKYLGING